MNIFQWTKIIKWYFWFNNFSIASDCIHFIFCHSMNFHQSFGQFLGAFRKLDIRLYCFCFFFSSVWFIYLSFRRQFDISRASSCFKAVCIQIQFEQLFIFLRFLFNRFFLYLWLYVYFLSLFVSTCFAHFFFFSIVRSIPCEFGQLLSLENKKI